MVALARFGANSLMSDTKIGRTPPSKTAIRVTGKTICFLGTVISAIAMAAASANRPKAKAAATMIRLRPKQSARRAEDKWSDAA